MVKLDLHYTDPRLVVLYDIDNQRGADTDFYLDLATEINAKSILDLGCGTGLLTVEFASEGRQVTGIDPSSAMLDIARQKTSIIPVTWVEGTSQALGTPEADLLTMTGNVAQIFLEDDDWLANLRDIHAALRSGGYLAFESRNPADEGWKRWNREATYEQIDSPNGAMECWLDVISVGENRVIFEAHNIFKDTGEDIVARSELRFRSREEITDSLLSTGFTVEHVYGNWNKDPFSITSRAMIFVARRN